MRRRRFLGGFLVALGSVSCQRRSSRRVVVYCAVDQVHAVPILDQFENRSGIAVDAVYDVETAKTTHLVGRLLLERDAPICDLFWNNEHCQTMRLAHDGLFSPYESPRAKTIPVQFKDRKSLWTGFAARARVIAYRTDRTSVESIPRSMDQLVDGKVSFAIADPRFGTTRTQVAALFAARGEESARILLDQVFDNAVVAPGNAMARDLVAQGVVDVGVTDSDDVYGGQREGLPIDSVTLESANGGLLIPNTAAILANAPHPAEARLLVDYLLSEETEATLASGRSAQIPVRESVARPPHVIRIPNNIEIASPNELLAGFASSQRWIEERFH